MAARHFGFYDDWKNELLTCPTCGWVGNFEQGSVEYHDELMDSSCPACPYPDAPMLAIVTFPTMEETAANCDKLTEKQKQEFRSRRER